MRPFFDIAVTTGIMNSMVLQVVYRIRMNNKEIWRRPLLSTKTGQYAGPQAGRTPLSVVRLPPALGSPAVRASSKTLAPCSYAHELSMRPCHFFYMSSICTRSSCVVCHHSCHHSCFALAFANSALDMVLVESNRLLEFPSGLLGIPSGFKCRWYGLPRPVQFTVLILMPALLYGVNRLFDGLVQASHACLCPYPTAAFMEEREGGRPEHIGGTLRQRKLDACSTQGSPRAPLPLRHHRLHGRTRPGRPACAEGT
ncbi:unnamed protein product [Ectocarpus sp. 4 AP-2014]